MSLGLNSSYPIVLPAFLSIVFLSLIHYFFLLFFIDNLMCMQYSWRRYQEFSPMSRRFSYWCELLRRQQRRSVFSMRWMHIHIVAGHILIKHVLFCFALQEKIGRRFSCQSR